MLLFVLTFYSPHYYCRQSFIFQSLLPSRSRSAAYHFVHLKKKKRGHSEQIAALLCANTDGRTTAFISTCNSLFPLRLTWMCLNSRKKSEQRGESVCAPHRQTPAGCGRLKFRATDYPIHHFMLILMEVSKHMSQS